MPHTYVVSGLSQNAGDWVLRGSVDGVEVNCVLGQKSFANVAAFESYVTPIMSSQAFPPAYAATLTNFNVSWTS
jgi:hypothetical protein